MENLSKENFWNELQAKCPVAVDHFCKWIDKYKILVGWNKLFNSDSDYQDMNGKNAPAPKFHDIPLEFQIGVLIRYELETSPLCTTNKLTANDPELWIKITGSYTKYVTDLFREIDEKIRGGKI